MYSLVQARIISHDALKENILPYGYVPAYITQGLWTQNVREVNFTLVVDNFGIKKIKQQDSDHLVVFLKYKYEVTQDWKGRIYYGIRLK